MKPREITQPRIRLRVHAGELTAPVLLDTHRSPDLAACGDRDRTGRHQNQIRDAQTVQVVDRRGNFTLNGGELVRYLLGGLAPLLDFDDDDKLLRALIRNRYRRAPTRCDLLDGRLDVVGRVVAPIHDQEILDAADDEQLVVKEESRVPGAQPRPLGYARRRSDKPSTERTFGLVRFPPIAHRDVVAVHPDLTDGSRRTLDTRLGINDADHR